jgi:hypothetical protein
MTEAVKPEMDFAFKDLGFDQLVFRTPLETNDPVQLKRKRVRA